MCYTVIQIKADKIQIIISVVLYSRQSIIVEYLFYY